jgi:hypothetical protein
MKHQYQVTFKTSDQRGAGTDAGVSFTLVGSSGVAHGVLNEGGWRLDGAGLRRGATKMVSVESEQPLGTIGAVVINFSPEPSRLADFVRGLLQRLPEEIKDFGKGVLRDPATSLGLDDAWNLEYVEVEHDGQRVHMPVHTWLSARDKAKMTVAFGASQCLPQRTPEYLKRFRALDLEDPEKNLSWEQRQGGDVPAISVYPLPLNFSHADRKARDFYGGLGVSIQSAVTGRLIELKNRLTLKPTDNFPDFQTYDVFFREFGGPPRMAANWKDDRYWGASFLTGPCAGYFQRVDALPARLAHLTDDSLRGPGGAAHPYMNGSSLAAEIAAKRIFIADFSMLKGLELKGDDATKFLDRRYCAPEACVLLRACTEQKPFQFLPIAIQLEDRKEAPLWLPSDAEWDWLTAKAFLMNAASAIHLIYLHWTMCHTAGGVFSAAVFKSFSTLHPLRSLLLPHVMYSVGLNRAAMGLLVNPTGIVEQIFSLGPHMFILDDRSSKIWSEEIKKPVQPDDISFEARSWSEWSGYMNMPREFKARGLDDKQALPQFPFRDLGMLLWDVLDSWVTEYLGLYYQSDDDCKNDPELHKFVNFLIEGFGKPPKNAPIDEYRAAKHSRKALHDLLLSYMFAVSVAHVQRNFTMYDFMAYPPFMSLLLRSPFPTKKGTCTERTFLDAMPSLFGTGAEVGLNGSLNRFSKDDWFIGKPLEEDWISDPAAVEAQRKYHAKLAAVGEEIERQNKALESAGAKHLLDPYLHPSRIPSCVAI